MANDILKSMYIQLQMDREVDKDSHYISPSGILGYEINGIFFDFDKHEGGRLASDHTIVEFLLTGVSDSQVVTSEDVKKGFDYFGVFLGDADFGDAEINITKVLEVHFEFEDEETGDTKTIIADSAIIESANNCLTNDKIA